MTDMTTDTTPAPRAKSGAAFDAVRVQIGPAVARRAGVPGWVAFPVAVTAAFGAVMLLIAIVDQRVQAFDRLDIDMPAAAAIAAIRSTKFDIGFTPEGSAPVSAMAGFDINLGLIEEFHRALLGDHEQKSERTSAPRG